MSHTKRSKNRNSKLDISNILITIFMTIFIFLTHWFPTSIFTNTASCGKLFVTLCQNDADRQENNSWFC